ncbi:MAG: DUF1634 domain-containing protein [Alloprevotella sp.]|nr:DUF1634 domain-containing protein [Alloprevotella sp.]
MALKVTSDPMQLRIARTLRWGVGIACALAAVGGCIYLVQHGAEPMKDYSHFSYGALPEGFENYTTLRGILRGVSGFTAYGWIQLGVLALLLTPVLRVLLSLVDFLRQRDWLYAAITAAVLAVIILNSVAP